MIGVHGKQLIGTGLLWALVALGLLGLAADAGAQLSSPSIANNSSVSEQGGGDPSYDRQSGVALASSTSTTFTVRYSASDSTDGGALCNNRTETLSADYTISFTATAAGAYTLNVSSNLVGQLDVQYDGGLVGGSADISAVNGSYTGGTLSSGGLGISDPGSCSIGGGNAGSCHLPINQSSGTAVITGTSNGSAVAHTLRFTWTASATTNTCSGHEAAARFGIQTRDGTNDAAKYPGNGSRTDTNDGHFVTVSMVSLCGDGTVQSGEQCDQGAANGTASSCCNANCTFKSGTTCRASIDGGVCDPAEVCDGASAACPADSFAGASTPCSDVTPNDCFDARCNGSGACSQTQAFETNAYTCRSAADVCDQPETCSGDSGSCPVDQFLSASATCRSAANSDCDVAEHCTGNSAACPSDGFQPAGTSCSDTTASDCFDAQCNGAGACSQTHSFETGSYVCRASTDGVCDPAETCTGSSGTCPTNAFTGAGTACADSTPSDCFDARCDGGGSCNQTATVEATTYICRSSTGECDPQEQCDGSTGACPNNAYSPQGTSCTDSNINDCFDAQCNGSGTCAQAQALEMTGYVCRVATDVCDAAEVCDGAVGACPADGFKANSVVCRASVDPVCDVAETCTGTTATCPSDGHVGNGTTCNDHSGCSTVDTCQGGICTGGSPPQDCGDGVLCTDDVCVSTGDASHTCSHPVSNTRCLVDGQCLTANQLNIANDCQQCDPGSSLTAWSNVAQGVTCATGFGLCSGAGTCEEPLAICGSTPVAAGECKGPAPGRAKLAIRNYVESTQDAIAFSLGKGDRTVFSDYGDPVRSTNYALCIYDSADTLKRELRIRPGEICKPGIECWKNVSAKKYVFKDKRDSAHLSHDGIAKILLQPGEQGKAKLSLKGKGVNLEPPLLPLSKPITAQLINGRGGCWGATFSAAGAKKDAGFAFVGVSD